MCLRTLKLHPLGKNNCSRVSQLVALCTVSVLVILSTTFLLQLNGKIHRVSENNASISLLEYGRSGKGTAIKFLSVEGTIFRSNGLRSIGLRSNRLSPFAHVLTQSIMRQSGSKIKVSLFLVFLDFDTLPACSDIHHQAA